MRRRSRGNPAARSRGEIVLQTERLILAPLGRLDEAEHARASRDPADALRDTRAADVQWREHGFGPWAIRDRRDNSFLGGAELRFAGDGIEGIAPDEVEAGWWVTEDRRNEGIATEAMQAAIDDLWSRTDAESVTAYVEEGENEPSHRLAASLGFVVRGSGRGRSGEPMTVYELRRDAWRRRPDRLGPLQSLLRAVEEAQAPAGVATRVIAIDGPGGAGKSSLAAWLADELGAAVIHTDDFASWDNPVGWWPELIEHALTPLAAGEPARYQPTVWAGEKRAAVVIEPGGTVILEGVTASRTAFRPYLALSIWIETDRALRLQRGIDRDGEAARGQWQRWMEEEDGYIESERPGDHADVVLRGDRDLWGSGLA